MLLIYSHYAYQWVGVIKYCITPSLNWTTNSMKPRRYISKRVWLLESFFLDLSLWKTWIHQEDSCAFRTSWRDSLRGTWCITAIRHLQHLGQWTSSMTRIWNWSTIRSFEQKVSRVHDQTSGFCLLRRSRQRSSTSFLPRK